MQIACRDEINNERRLTVSQLKGSSGRIVPHADINVFCISITEGASVFIQAGHYSILSEQINNQQLNTIQIRSHTVT